jgi:PPP family 3-phenylpropionic acid transporter
MRQLGLFYFALLAAAGILLPFFNLHLKQLGFSDWQIGLVAAITPLSRIVFPGFWGALADRSAKRNALLITGCAGMTLALGWVMTVTDFTRMLVAVLVMQVFSSLTGPLVDACALVMASEQGFHYGRVRVWGSVGFIVAALVVGKLLDGFSTTVGLGCALVCCAAATGAAVWMPPLPHPPPVAGAGRARRRDLLRQPEIAALMLTGLLAQVSHGAYYNFFTIYLRAEGYAPSVISALWGLAVAAEVGLIYKSDALVRRFGSRWLITVSLVAAAVRWGALALSSAWPVLVLIQPLHALSFGGVQMGGMYFIHERFPDQLKVSGQSFFTVASWGAGYLIGSLFAGWGNFALGAPWSFGISAFIALAGAWVAFAGLRARGAIGRAES